MALKVSIITAVYNNRATIENAILSVALQSHKPIEHILIDGGSTDGTIEVIKKHIGSVAVFISGPDRGIYNALNKGFSSATGDIIGILHSDDTFAGYNTIEQVVKVFDTLNPDGVYGNLQYVDKDNPDKVFRHWKSCEFRPDLLKKGWMPPHPTLFLKKELVDSTGFYNEKYCIAADYDYMLRALLTPSVRFVYLPIVVTRMRTGGASNKNLQNIMLKMWEDYLILRNNKVGGLWALMLKNFSKLGQLLVKPD